MRIIGYKAWMADGKLVRQARFADLPSEGIVIMMAYYDEFFDTDKRYRKVVDGCDWYYYQSDDIHGVRSHEVEGEWAPKPEGIADILIKKSAPQLDIAAFNRITEASMKDLVF